MFARAVSDIRSTGEDSPERIADLLTLRPELIRILMERVDELGPTPATASMAPTHESIAYIARDAVTGLLLNRFVESRQEMPAEHDDRRGAFRIRLGGRATDSFESYRYILPDTSSAPDQPSPSEVLDAIGDFIKLMRRGNPDLPNALQTWGRLRAEVLVGVSPTPWFIPVSVHPSDIDEGGWAAWDPFIGADARVLMRLVRDKASTLTWLDRMTSDVRHVPAGSEQAMDLSEEAYNQLIVDCPYATAALIQTDAGQLAVKAYRHRFEAILYADEGRRRQQHLEDAVTAAGKAVESVLQASIRNWPCGEEGVTWMSQRGRSRSDGMNSMLTSLGAPTVPDKLRDVMPAHVELALIGRPNGLRSLLYASLVSAVLYPSHPLRTAIVRLPSMITLWDGLADQRNAAAHGGERRIAPLDPQEADDLVRLSVQAVMTLQHMETQDTGERE